MSGVEAAASLFGSEESSSDLFATLGTESTSPQQFSEASSTSNDGSFLPEAPPIPLQPDPYTSATPDFSHYPTYSTAGTENTTSNFPYGSKTNSQIEQWSGHYEQNYSGTEYSDYSEPATSDYSAYAPPTETTYSPPTTTTTMYQPITATYSPSSTAQTSSTTTFPTQTPAHSSYSAYDPPPMAPSSYTSYAPKPQAYVSPNPPYSSATTTSGFIAPPYNTSSTSQAPNTTPVKTTLNRPKVSNAYDPPFLQSLPSRKPRSTSSVSQMYSQYQSHVPSSHSQTNEDSAYNHYQPPPSISRTDNQNYLSDVSPSSYARPIHQAEPFRSQNESSPVASSTATHVPYSFASEQQYHDDDFGGNPPAEREPKTASDFQYTPEVSHAEHQNHESQFPVVQPPTLRNMHHSYERRSIDDPPASNAISPRSIPLPFSPPTQKADIADHDALLVDNEMSNRSNSFHKPPPPQIPKRDVSTSRDSYHPYAPKSNQSANNYIPRTSSPLSTSSGRVNGRKTPVSTALNHSPYGSIPRPLVNIPSAISANVPVDGSRQMPHWSEHNLAPQDIIVKATAGQYAPSPSLIGANDPLSRTSARAPVVTFGFGGKMVTCFHGMPGQNAGFDVALSSRTTSELKIHVLQKFLPESTLNAAGPSYPGPLLSDPGTSSLSLVRPGQTTQVKTKKAGVLTYLSGRAGELHQGLGYFSSAEKQAAEDKIILVRLLSVMIENDGRLLGTPQADSAVRSVLVPRLEGVTILPDGASLQASFNPSIPGEVPVSTITVRPSALDKIEELLLQGNRRQAYQFAMDQKLWAHALIIASSIDKDSWKEVVNDFLRTELGSKEDAARLTSGDHSQTKSNNRDSLRVAYSLFSGQGAASIQELAPINLLQRASGRLQPPPAMLSTLTPRTPNFPVIQSTIPSETLSHWAETAAMILSSPLTPEVSGALTALGDQLLAQNWVEAAHSCYLLSSQTSSLFAGLGNPSARIVLLGSKNPADPMKDSDTIIFSEILEFALSLIPVVKGHEPFHGSPHLQAYKFLRAVSLAEIGDIQLANRYCEAIASSLSQASPHTTVALIEQLQGLQQRISGVVHGEKGSSWIGGKISKPSLDTIGGWLEGRFTKLVTGDADEPTPTAENAKSTGQPFAGPFAHYSTISSTTPSARSSPQPSFTNLSTLPPQRTTSAMATSTPYSQVQVERASSAMGYVRQKPTVQTSKDTGSISSSQSSPTGYGLNGQSYNDPYTPKYDNNTAPADETETPVQAGSSWWGSSDDNGVTATPTAATFVSVANSSMQPSSDGFVSLMDNNPYSIGPQFSNNSGSSSPRAVEEVYDDDLGLGNSKPKPKKEETQESKDEVQSTPIQSSTPAAVDKPTEAPASNGGSWFGRWWKRSDSSTPGPIKASLGEESAFYYDKDLKRWVNKNAAPESPKPAAPPPPPSRAQTASPGRTGPRQPASAPPARSASAIDLSTEPPTKVPMRIRSNLAPPTESAPSTPTGTRMNANGAPPPPGRPKSSAAKRNIRSRYVDVFQQETGGAS